MGENQGKTVKLDEILGKDYKIGWDGIPDHVITQLTELGLTQERAEQLVRAKRTVERYKDAIENIKKIDPISVSLGISNFNNLTKNQHGLKEAESNLLTAKSTCVFLIQLNSSEVQQVDDTLLGELSEKNIGEDEINNPTLRLAFNYYKKFEAEKKENEGLRRDKERNEQQIIRLEYDNGRLARENEGLKAKIRSLTEQFQTRLSRMNELYKKALAQRNGLQTQLEQTQNKKLSSILADKLASVFGKETKKMPELEALPVSLLSPAEEMGVASYGEEMDERAVENGRCFKRSGFDLEQ